jgi:hypothetical protein
MAVSLDKGADHAYRPVALLLAGESFEITKILAISALWNGMAGPESGTIVLHFIV